MLISAVSCLLFSVILFGGCRKELCYDHPHGQNVKIVADWGEYSVPEGIRVVFYPLSGPATSFINSNLPAQGGSMFLPEGEYQLLVHNNDTEYILFDSTEDVQTYRATSTSASRKSYVKSDNEITLNEPDYLYSAYIEHIVKTRSESDTLIIRVSPELLVQTYTFTIRGKGLEYVTEARGAITGMAKSVFLASKQTCKEQATIFFTARKTPEGLFGEIKTFGHCNHELVPHIFTAELLYPGGVVQKKMDVTEQLHENNHIDLYIDIDYDPSTGNVGSGFDASVDDWDEVDVDLPM